VEQRERFREEEAEQILRIAASLGSPSGDYDHSRLVAMASELGIPESSVLEAERIYIEKRKTETEKAEFERYMRREFLGHLYTYLAINVGLSLYNLLHHDQPSWWLAIGWGVIVALHAWETFARDSDDYNKAFRKWQRRQRRRREAQKQPPGSIMHIVDEIATMYDFGHQRMDAVRELRRRTGMDVAEAKKAIEEYEKV
jgi:hypothetical protein